MKRLGGDISQEVAGMSVSAIQLAELADVSTKDVHYWAREKFLKRNQNGSRRPFGLSELPKARLMGELTKKYEMRASQAAHLADELLLMHENEPDTYVAAMSILEAFDKSLETLARVMAKLGIVEALAEEGLVDLRRFAAEIEESERRTEDVD